MFCGRVEDHGRLPEVGRERRGGKWIRRRVEGGQVEHGMLEVDGMWGKATGGGRAGGGRSMPMVDGRRAQGR
jgi:hypothetical protein